MRYILVLIVIIGTVTYVFIGGPKSVASQTANAGNRREEVWEAISRLERSRRDMLLRAEGRMGAVLPPARASRNGAYAAGYREGFDEGYFVGSFLAERREPNPMFLPIPSP